MAVAHNNTATAVTATNASSLSAAMSVTAGGSNLCAVARVAVGKATTNPTDVTSVTYNSVAMTSAGAVVQANQTNIGCIKAFVLVAPSTGSNTLAVSISNGPATTIYADLGSYTGVDQTTPVRAGSYTTANSAATAGTTQAVTVPSAVGDMTTSVCTAVTGSQGITSTNKTQRNINNTGQTCLGTDDAAGAATVTHTWTYQGSTAGRLVLGFSLAAAGASGSPYTMAADRATFTETGNAAGLLFKRLMPATTQTYSLTGITAGLLYKRLMSAAVGSFALTGFATGLLKASKLTAANGSYTLTGNAAGLTYAPSGAYTLLADRGVFTLTGQSVNLNYSAPVGTPPAVGGGIWAKKKRVFIEGDEYFVNELEMRDLLQAMLEREIPEQPKTKKAKKKAKQAVQRIAEVVAVEYPEVVIQAPEPQDDYWMAALLREIAKRYADELDDEEVLLLLH